MTSSTLIPRRPTHDLSSETVTEGFRVSVRPQFLRDQSKPAQNQYLFLYHVTIRNEGEAPARLRRRHWTIVDADGEHHDVDGEGVVGHTPRLEPGQHFEYASYCPITTPWGTMEGWYEMHRDDESTFRIAVGRFYLVSQAVEDAAPAAAGTAGTDSPDSTASA